MYVFHLFPLLEPLTLGANRIELLVSRFLKKPEIYDSSDIVNMTTMLSTKSHWYHFLIVVGKRARNILSELS